MRDAEKKQKIPLPTEVRMGFTVGEVVTNLPLHPSGTGGNCDGMTGTIKQEGDIVDGGGTAYVTCDTCSESIRAEL